MNKYISFGKNTEFSEIGKRENPVLILRDDFTDAISAGSHSNRFKNFESYKHVYDPSGTPGGGETIMSSNKDGLSKVEFWVGIGAAILSLVIAAVGTTWAVSSKIYDNNNSVRQELTGVMQNSKTELAARVDKLDTKVDAGFKETSNNINDIKVLLLSKDSKGK